MAGYDSSALAISPQPDAVRSVSASALVKFENYLRLEKRAAENTISNYLRDVRKFDGWLELRGKALEQADREHVQTYISSRMSEGLSGRSAQRNLAVFRSFYGLLLDDDIIRVKPTAGIPSPRVVHRLPKILSAEDVDVIVRWLDASDDDGKEHRLRDKAIVLMLFASGLRESELVNLKLAALDLDQGFVKVWNGKGGKDGIVPLSPPAIEALRAYLETERRRLDPEQRAAYVFLSNHHKGKISRQGLYYRLRTIGRAALGKEISPHQFRHACATELLKGGADIRDVQAILRHSDINTTQIYLHTDMTYLRGIYAKSHPRA